ncbi:hypothetical protein AAC387_Pa02g0144 [Persea americana]
MKIVCSSVVICRSNTKRWWTIFYLLTLSNDLSLIAGPYEAIKVTGLEMIIMATALSGTPWQDERAVPRSDGLPFHPTEEELLHYYLRKRVAYEKIDVERLREQ